MSNYLLLNLSYVNLSYVCRTYSPTYYLCNLETLQCTTELRLLTKAFPRIRISLHKLSNCNLKLIFWLFMCSSTDLNSFSPRNLTFFLSHNDMSHHLNSLVSKCTVHHLIFQFSPITAVMYILTPNQVAKFLKDKVQFF